MKKVPMLVAAAVCSNRWTSFAELQGEVGSDVIVIGGGIVATTLALGLARPEEFTTLRKELGTYYNGNSSERMNLQVTLLEKVSIASGATGLSTGTLYSTGQLLQGLQPSAAVAGTAIMHYSSMWYQKLHDASQDEGGIEYVECGTVQLAESEDEENMARVLYKEARGLCADSSNVEFLDSLGAVRAKRSWCC
jgi:glycine/D-amino acid oxidase-like deaminating enzyme